MAITPESRATERKESEVVAMAGSSCTLSLVILLLAILSLVTLLLATLSLVTLLLAMRAWVREARMMRWQKIVVGKQREVYLKKIIFLPIKIWRQAWTQLRRKDRIKAPHQLHGKILHEAQV